MCEIELSGWLNLLTKYWSQLAMLFLSLGYLYREARQFYLKKKEINHSLFQKRKLDSVDEYIKACVKYKQAVSNASLYLVLIGSAPIEDLDNTLTVSINGVRSASGMMELYFEKNIFSKFREITNELNSIDYQIHRITLQSNRKENAVAYSNEFEAFKIEKYKIIESLISDALCDIRESMTKRRWMLWHK